MEFSNRLKVALKFIAERYAQEVSVRVMSGSEIFRCRPEQIAYLVAIRESPSSCLLSEFQSDYVAQEKINKWTRGHLINIYKSFGFGGGLLARIVGGVLDREPSLVSRMVSEPNRNGVIDLFILHEIGHIYVKQDYFAGKISRSEVINIESRADEYAFDGRSGGATDRLGPALSLLFLWASLVDLNIGSELVYENIIGRSYALQDSLCRNIRKNIFRPPAEVSPDFFSSSTDIESILGMGCDSKRSLN